MGGTHGIPWVPLSHVAVSLGAYVSLRSNVNLIGELTEVLAGIHRHFGALAPLSARPRAVLYRSFRGTQVGRSGGSLHRDPGPIVTVIPAMSGYQRAPRLRPKVLRRGSHRVRHVHQTRQNVGRTDFEVTATKRKQYTTTMMSIRQTPAIERPIFGFFPARYHE